MDVVFAIVFMLVVGTIIIGPIVSDKCLFLLLISSVALGAVVVGGMLFALGLAIAHWMGIY